VKGHGQDGRATIAGGCFVARASPPVEGHGQDGRATIAGGLSAGSELPVAKSGSELPHSKVLLARGMLI